MRKLCLLSAVLLLTALAFPAFAQTGNGAPNGSHYNLNIIGTEKAKSADMTGSNRHTIFVDIDYHDATPTSPTPLTSLNPKNKIFLQEGPFQVIDGNAWDGALFQLPAPDCTGLTVDATNLECSYSVWVRGLGSPKNNPYANITTCAKDAGGDLLSGTGDDTYQCSTETVTVERRKGKSTFTNVTKELLTMCVDLDGIIESQPCDERIELFDDDFYQYFWDYDNFGLRLAQLRFYPKNPE